jgi:DNA-binding NarL/FixJ family response regulator
MLKVFIADDSVVVRGRLKEALEELGAIEIVGESGDAKQAIQEIRRSAPDVVILDIRMPGGGGLPVLMDIKTRDPNLVVIVFTSFPMEQYRQKSQAAGADYFFDKTQDIQKLTDVLAELASKNGGSPDG